MKKNKESYTLKIFSNEFDFIAEYIETVLNIDVRENTESRAFKLPQYRYLFFNIAIQSTKSDLATIGSYLGKDHATVVHAKKMWENEFKEVYGKYLIQFLENKENFKSFTGTTAILSYEVKISALRDKIRLLQLEVFKEKNNTYKDISNPYLKDLLKLNSSDIDLFCKTRLEPFLKMNKLVKKPLRKMKRIVSSIN